jgi:hypothetical protein
MKTISVTIDRQFLISLVSTCCGIFTIFRDKKISPLDVLARWMPQVGLEQMITADSEYLRFEAARPIHAKTPTDGDYQMTAQV